MAVLTADNETGQITTDVFKGTECPNCGGTLMHGESEVRFTNKPVEDEQYAEGRIEGTCNIKVCVSCGYLRTDMEVNGYDGY